MSTIDQRKLPGCTIEPPTLIGAIARELERELNEAIPAELKSCRLGAQYPFSDVSMQEPVN